MASRSAVLVVLLLVGSTFLPAQWSANAASNKAVADRTGDQAVPKLAATPDGGGYVAWFDHAGANYDVYLQRLDANGYEAWPHNGLLVSANAQATSLVDWDLICDSSGNAVLTFTDIRAGGDLDVYAYRISPAGAFLWGANGVALSNDAHFEANPVVAEMTDGTFAFAWMRSVSGAVGRLVMQKLDALGTPLFGTAGIEVFGGATDDPGFVGIVAAPNAAFILAWIRDITPFSAPRHLHTRKFDAVGTPVWGSSALSIYDAGALPIAFKPELQSDGSGGAFYAWHVSVGSFFQGRVQHVNAAGTEVFAHNGVEISLEANRSEFNPSMAQLAGTGDLIVFYNKRDAAQGQWGIGGQRISATGQLLWGNNGIEFVPYDSVTEENPRAVPMANGAMCFVEQGNFSTTLLGFAVNAAGVALWAPSPRVVSSTVSPKDKLRAVVAADGTALLAWNDARTDINDVYVQNVEMDGSLGVPPALVAPYGCGVNENGSLAVLSGSASLGSVLLVGVDSTSTGVSLGSLPILALAVLPDAAWPCGLQVPNMGLAGPAAPGELLIDLSTLFIPLLAGPPWAGPGSPAAFALPVPYMPALVNVSVYLQGALVDSATGRIGLTNALRVRMGP